MIVTEDELFEASSKIDSPSDITDPNSYTIQEVKLKSEHDKEVEDAEKKKQVIFPVFFMKNLGSEFP